MNKMQCGVIILIFQITLVFSYISKEVFLIKRSYRNQKIEREVATLKDQLQEKITIFNTLHVRSIMLKQIRAEGMEEIKPQQLHDLADFPAEASV
jgi:hypothetical protein